MSRDDWRVLLAGAAFWAAGQAIAWAAWWAWTC